MAAAPDCDLLVRDTTLLDCGWASGVVREHHDLAVTGGVISAVEPAGRTEFSAVHTIDGSGYCALPGFVNAHAHGAMSLFRGLAEDVDINTWFNEIIWRVESNLTGEDAYWGMKLAIVEMLENGVTTVADHYMFMPDIAKACVETGIRAHLAPTMFGQRPDEELAQARAFVEEWRAQEAALITPWLGPHSPYLCSPEFLRRCVELAGDLGVGLHMHVSETRQQVRDSLKACGLTPPKHMQKIGLYDVPVLFAHATHATSDDIRLFGEHDVGVAHCPKTFLKLASGIANLVEMLDKGVAVGLGTDGPASNNTLDILEQMRLAALLQKHEHQSAALLQAEEALRLASHGGSRAVKQAAEGALLEVGRSADLVLLDISGAHLQPLHNLTAALVYSARGSDVDTVVIGGKLIVEHRRLLTVDKEEVVAEASRRGFNLAGRPAGALQRRFPGVVEGRSEQE